MCICFSQAYTYIHNIVSHVLLTIELGASKQVSPLSHAPIVDKHSHKLSPHTASQEVDRYANEHPDFLVLVAAGNDGPNPHSVVSPGTAKNALSVGASYSEMMSSDKFMRLAGAQCVCMHVCVCCACQVSVCRHFVQAMS
jgi:hypothetical protein